MWPINSSPLDFNLYALLGRSRRILFRDLFAGGRDLFRDFFAEVGDLCRDLFAGVRDLFRLLDRFREIERLFFSNFTCIASLFPFLLLDGTTLKVTVSPTLNIQTTKRF